jgi:hypothetical protein
MSDDLLAFDTGQSGSPFFIEGFTLNLTSFAYPEQYEVFDKDGNQCGYIRLRNGKLRCDFPDCGDETLYSAEPKGDGWFADNEERQFYLAKIIECIKERIHQR